MRFVLSQIKAISTVLLLGLFVLYLYFSFIFEASSPTLANTLANITLLFFVLMMLLCGLCAVIFEKLPTKPEIVTVVKNKKSDTKEGEQKEGEQSETAEQTQTALPENLLSLLEQSVASLSSGKEALNSVVSENKEVLSSVVSENKNSLSVALEDLMSKLTSLSSKNAAPLNLALENINTRLDDLENKIISNRLNEPLYTAENTANNTFSVYSEPETAAYNEQNNTSYSEPEQTFVSSEAPLYDAGATENTVAYNEPEAETSYSEPTETAFNEPEQTFVSSEAPLYDAGATENTVAYNEPEAETSFSEPEAVAPSSEEPLDDAGVSDDNGDAFKYNKGLSGFENELSELADLDIMSDANVAADADKNDDFEDIDINKILQNTENTKENK